MACAGHKRLECHVCRQPVRLRPDTWNAHRREHERELVDALVAIAMRTGLAQYADVELLQDEATVSALPAARWIGYIDGNTLLPRRTWWANLLTEVNARIAAERAVRGATRDSRGREQNTEAQDSARELTSAEVGS